MSVDPCQRWSRNNRCPICGGCQRDRPGTGRRCSGFAGDDGRWAHCSREEAAGPLQRGGGGTYAHRMAGPCSCGVSHGPGPATASRDRPAPAPAAPAPAIDPDARDAVYRALLAAFPLSAAHRAYLTGPACGLGPAELATYGTLPEARDQGEQLAPLLARFGRAALLTVPGFVPAPTGICLSGAGMLLAMCDAAGRVVGVQVRRDGPGDGPRYYWLSSLGHGGPSSGAPAHVARPAGGAGTGRRIWLTEGGKKAQICAARTGCVTIGLAGHAQLAAAMEPLRALQAEGADVLVVALDEDADPATAAAVGRSRGELARRALEMGYAVRFARWDHARGKGIDDLLLGGHRPALQICPGGIGTPDEAGAGERADDAGAPRRLRQLRRAILQPDLAPAEKVVLLVAMIRAEAYPLPAGQIGTPARLAIAAIAHHAAISADRAGKATRHLHDLGLLVREDTREFLPPEQGGAPRTIVSFAPGRELAWDERLPEAPHKEVDRARKRACPDCGCTRLVVAEYGCTGCGRRFPAREGAGQEDRPARGAAAGGEAESAGGPGVSPGADWAGYVAATGVPPRSGSATARGRAAIAAAEPRGRPEVEVPGRGIPALPCDAGSPGGGDPGLRLLRIVVGRDGDGEPRYLERWVRRAPGPPSRRRGRLFAVFPYDPGQAGPALESTA